MWLKPDQTLLLASNSPRRVELLAQLNIPVLQVSLKPVEGEDEPRLEGENVVDYVQRTASDKMERAIQELSVTHPTWPILTADTTVAINQTLFGKPNDHEDAKQILKNLSARTHQVYTAVVLSVVSDDDHPTRQLLHALSTTHVTFASMTDEWIEQYVASGEPFGKGGGYGIQGLAASKVVHIDGSYSGVMGLPMYETAQLLRQCGLYQP